MKCQYISHQRAARLYRAGSLENVYCMNEATHIDNAVGEKLCPKHAAGAKQRYPTLTVERIESKP